MTYRLIAFDLDGTLMGSEQTFSPRVRHTLSAAQANGAHVTLATGRSYLSARPFAAELGISVPLVCYQGGLIVEPGGHVLHQLVLRRELAAQVLALAAERDWHATLYQDGQIYVTEMRHSPAFYYSMLNPGVQHVADWQTLLERDPDKVLLVAEDPAQTELIYAEMRKRFSASMQIVRSHALFVEANPPGVNKGAGLAWLADYLGVEQAQVMAVGDQDNDVSMLAWAGLGVAMGNASPDCRAAADWIAPPLEEDGAAVAIEHFVLGA
jgi:Cof subfamily protein (haloacid dehalogenase superfamily)